MKVLSWMRAETPGKVSRARQGATLNIKRIWPFYLMLLPVIAYFVIFHYVPMYGAIIAFKDYKIFDGILGSEWVGFKHFEALFTGPFFWRILRNTLVISFLKLILGYPPCIMLALMLNEVRMKGLKNIVQTVTYLPHFFSWVIVYAIALNLLSPSSGLINVWIKEMGGTPISFFGDHFWFLAVIVLSDIWKETGFGAIIFLAALAGIDPQLYEAAIVDGANKFQQILHISLPGISSVMILVLILWLGSIMNAGFEQIYIFYNPRVMAVADIIDTWVFRNGIEQFRFSLATATGLFMSVVGLVMILTSNMLAKRWSGQGLW